MYSVPGPNYQWHMDGYDKLSPYGICIHAAIDGYSRKLLWLNADYSNKNPSLIANYYTTTVKELGGAPSVLRCDPGTETFDVADIQTLLREGHNDTMANVAVMYGSSTHNQRIERWWGFLRQSLITDYQMILSGMRDTGLLDTSDPIHMDCVRFCFTGVLRKELNGMKEHWNSHRVRRMKHIQGPTGIPNMIYNSPELFGSQNYLHAVNIDHLNQCIRIKTSPYSEYGCREDFAEVAVRFMNLHGWQIPNNVTEASKLFVQMSRYIDRLL